MRIHIKNNRWNAASFPNTPEGEAVFTITQARFDTALQKFPQLSKKIKVTIGWDEDEFDSAMADADVLLTWDLPQQRLARVSPRLKWIHCIGAGVEHLTPLEWMPESVVLTNNKGVHAAKAGEFGLMAALMLHNHMPKIITNQVQQRFQSPYSTPIAGQVIVIVGTGSLGGAAAQALSHLGPHIIGVNRRGAAVDGCAQVVTVQQLDEVLPKADLLYLAMPETEATRGLINKRRLDLLKPSCSVVNVGRQSAMDYHALAAKLTGGELAGALLDVFTPEPIADDSYLWQVPNLIITPHVSADDGDSYVPLTLNLFLRNLCALIDEQPLQNQVSLEHGY